MNPLDVGLGALAALSTFVAYRAWRAWRAERTRGDRLAAELRRVSAEADSAVEASRDRFEDLARAAPVGFFEADADGNVVYLSERAATLLGLDRASARGAGWIEAVHPDDREHVRAAWRRIATEGSDFAEPFRCPNGEATRWILAQAVALTEPTGAIARIVGTLSDVSEQRRLEERVRETQRIESLALLAGGVAHDFNNLLHGISGQADVVKARLPADSPLRDLVEQIEVAALRGSDLAKKMLSYAGKGVVSVEPVDVRELTDEMVRLLGVRVPGLRPEHGVERLPTVEADPVQLRQVVLNLIVNASESYPSGSGDVIARTGVRTWPGETAGRIDVVAPTHDGEFVVFEVEDRGGGMEPRSVTAAFDPFFTTKSSGRGLGLAVVLGVVRRHGGGLTVRTSIGEGTTTTVWLPPTRAGE
ncbi:MAG: nitrogen regulation protein NR(II) [Planctomycetota bacterium JB042]